MATAAPPSSSLPPFSGTHRIKTRPVAMLNQCQWRRWQIKNYSTSFVFYDLHWNTRRERFKIQSNRFRWTAERGSIKENWMGKSANGSESIWTSLDLFYGFTLACNSSISSQAIVRYMDEERSLFSLILTPLTLYMYLLLYHLSFGKTCITFYSYG